MQRELIGNETKRLRLRLLAVRFALYAFGCDWFMLMHMLMLMHMVQLELGFRCEMK
jgi:hypothetical protein